MQRPGSAPMAPLSMQKPWRSPPESVVRARLPGMSTQPRRPAIVKNSYCSPKVPLPTTLPSMEMFTWYVPAPSEPESRL
jgi:hypothetical protein